MNNDSLELQVERAISQHVKQGEDELEREIGLRLKAIGDEYRNNPMLTIWEPRSALTDTSQLQASVLDDTKALARRFLDQTSMQFYSLICDEKDPDNSKIRLAIEEGVETGAKILAGVFIAHLAWAPGLAVLVASLLVKRIASGGHKALCMHWAKEITANSKRDPSPADSPHSPPAASSSSR